MLKRCSPRRDRIGAVLASALVLLAALALTDAPAIAQERPRTLLDMLFGNGLQQPRPVYRIDPRARAAPPAQRQPIRRARKPRPKRPAPSAAAAPTAPTVAEKADDAKTVLVVGDFLAASLAGGLEDAYADNDMVRIQAAANGSSGLVRQDHYDWSRQLGPLIQQNKPAVVVMMIGSNDRQPIRSASGTLALRSPEWDTEYERRVDAIASIVQKSDVPLVWVGMPPFKYDRMSEDMVFFNDLYLQATNKVSGAFVQVWEGFVDENDGFVYSGPGVDGQTVQLRNSDGITMTDAGDAKLAFFAKKAIDRYMAGETSTAVGKIEPGMQLPPIANAANAVRTPPMSLDDPSLDGGDALLGGGSGPALTLQTSPRDKLVLTGRGTGHVNGRADDFAWNDKAGAVASGNNSIAYRGSLDMNKVRAEQGIKPPKPMPSILDAIMDDWAKQQQQQQDTPAKP
ncbi:SGNH/GDSL hydrolase family protein [Jiella flava]|nr:SGNH family hydrolase [Jiella flava]